MHPTRFVRSPISDITVSLYQYIEVMIIPSNQLKRNGSARPSTDCLREFSMT